jgi:osomolarity two-component system sensor histidine kinase NIK1
MLGDREKCIQAQMDEYLSKPLKQTHLIQTILKCATLGGQLLETGREKRTSPKDETPAHNVNNNNPIAKPELTRPAMELRSFTTTGPINHGSLESPALVSADQDDPPASNASAQRLTPIRPASNGAIVLWPTEF